MRKKYLFQLGMGVTMVASVLLITDRLTFSQQAQGEESSLVKVEVPGEVLSLESFIYQAIRNDSQFEQILVDELNLQYEKDLQLPAKDLVLEVKSQYDFILSQDREEPEDAVTLSKLFPWTGTDVAVSYDVSPTLTSDRLSSEFTVAVSQPIASNAFGKATRLKDKIVGLEMDVAKHQIIEAYEDYLATMIVGYYDWYEAYANLLVGESSYNENVKLLDNIKDRQKNNIALPIDVNKVHLQVLAKKEKLIDLKEAYAKALNFIETAIRYQGTEGIIPQKESLYADLNIDFKKDFDLFKEDSRTFKVLGLLEEKSTLEVDYEADDLLPSIDLLVGYEVKGKDFGIKDEDNLIYAGISFEWPFGHQIDRAEYENAKIDLTRTQIANESTYFQLYKEIKDLSFQMESEKAFVLIAEEKIHLAKSILEDETENYSFGKVTLNDYIDAVNVLDTNRFNEILHDAQYKKLIIEWLRLNDRLVDANRQRMK